MFYLHPYDAGDYDAAATFYARAGAAQPFEHVALKFVEAEEEVVPPTIGPD